MNKIHCSLAYHESPFDELASFAGGVKAGYFGNNPPFTVLPLTKVAYQGLISDFDTKHTAYVNGGLAQKGPYLLPKQLL